MIIGRKRKKGCKERRKRRMNERKNGKNGRTKG
jgi:hypothetical protein